MRQYNARPGTILLRRKSRLRVKYGIEPERYSELYTDQDGKCAICRSALDNILESQEHTTAAVDHDHTTGSVRGLLCSPCNCAIGYMQDDPLRLEAAARYLRAA